MSVAIVVKHTYANLCGFSGDLEGSTGLKVIHPKHPEVFVPSGIMERGNFSAAAGFGFDAEKFGVFSTFSAFLEMVISEITMARLNFCNILCHFSHSGGMACALLRPQTPADAHAHAQWTRWPTTPEEDEELEALAGKNVPDVCRRRGQPRRPPSVQTDHVSWGGASPTRRQSSSS